MPKSCRKLAVQLSLSLEEEMKMTMRTWMTMKVYRVCPKKSMMTRLKTAVRCQTLRATAATVTQKQVRQSLKIELKEEVIESQEEL